ncbi:hypothetical protein Lal_00010958 [Lupinus albus]|nr:hypothetical protein Lal_00010958 [Lupinus albus]
MDSESGRSESQTNPLSDQFSSLNDLCHDLSSLQDLATRGAWRSIIDKVARSRALSLLHKPHDHITYLAFNALAFTKLRRFNEASSELDSMEDLDSSHYRYETYPKIYPNRVGSMVPFCLRWIHALIPIKLGHRQQGLDRLYKLLDFTRTKITEKEKVNLTASLSAWRKREGFVMNCIIGEHLSHKEFGVCLSLINDLLTRDPNDPVLISQLGYIQLQIGDLEGAKVSFTNVENLMKESKSNGSLSEVELKNIVNRNKALVYMVEKDYVSAVREYEECIERDDICMSWRMLIIPILSGHLVIGLLVLPPMISMHHVQEHKERESRKGFASFLNSNLTKLLEYHSYFKELCLSQWRLLGKLS